MSRRRTEPPRTLSLSEARRIEEARARFAADWHAGLGPNIESALARAPECDRRDLFPDLLALERGYPLLIAGSGLGSGARQVWFTTAMAEVAYGLLALDSYRSHAWEHEQFPNIFMATLAVTGFVIARQVRRIRSLSLYYEHRAVG